MNKKVLTMLEKTLPQLIWALISGGAYFVFVLHFILAHSEHGNLLAWFFSPLIICGVALILIKLVKSARESGNDNVILRLFYGHVVFIILAAVYAVASFI